MTHSPRPCPAYRAVLLDIGWTLIGPREPFGSVYARVHRDLGIDLTPERFEHAIDVVWGRFSQEIPAGQDRYAHFPDGETGYWRRFCEQVYAVASGEPPEPKLIRGALERLWHVFSDAGAWEVYPDVRPTLDAFKDAGLRLGVVSNWDSRLPRTLRMLDLDGYFDAVGVSHLEGVEKPDPELFRRVLDRLGVEPQEAIHVGDVPELDLAGATAAGVACRLIDRRGRLEGSEHRAMRELSEMTTVLR